MHVVELSASAGTIHGRALAGSATLWFCRPTSPALVLGSAQRDVEVDLAVLDRRGADVVRRRGGGGAVWVDDTVSWFDIDIGSDDPRWTDDVGRAFHWVGRAVAEALASVGLAPEVHFGALESTPWSRLVCFAGVGPGEVLIDGRKLVGISQRRTRDCARFMCQIHDVWNPADVLDAVAMSAIERRIVLDAVTDSATDLTDVGVARSDFEAALVEALSQ